MPVVDFNVLLQEARSAGTALPNGDYPLQVEEASAVAAGTGSPMIKFKMAIIGGPHAGKKVTGNFVMSVDNPIALRMFFRRMAVFGIPETYFAQLGQQDAVTALGPVAQAMIGRQAMGTLAQDEWPKGSGSFRNNVADVKPMSGMPAGAGIPPGMPGPGATPGAAPGLPGLPGMGGLPGLPGGLPQQAPAPAPAAAPGLPGLPGMTNPQQPIPQPVPGPAPTTPQVPQPTPPTPGPVPPAAGAVGDLMASMLGGLQPQPPARDTSTPPPGYEQYAEVWGQVPQETRDQVWDAAQAAPNGQVAQPAQPAQPPVPQAGPMSMAPQSPLG